MRQPVKRRECPRCRELYDNAQSHLRRMVELMEAQRQALENRCENTCRTLDQQVELEFGEKERALGALHEHVRTSH